MTATNQTTPSTPEPNRGPEQPESVNMWTALKLGAQQTFTWSQRISRPQYWWLYLDLVLITIALNLILGLKAYSSPALLLQPFHINAFQAVLVLIYSALLAWTSVMQFTASARRLHDSNRSAHFLWLSLIPIVGPILIIVFLCQRSNEAGARFDRAPKQAKPWTKKWWTWAILVVGTVLCAIMINTTAYITTFADYATTTTSTNTTNSDDDASDTDSETADSESSSSDDTDKITIGDDDIDIADQQSYTTAFTDSSWANSTFKINRVTVYKTDGTYTNGSGSDKQEFHGIIKVHMSIHAGRDISAYPTQAKLSTNDGQQVEADSDSDDFDGELNSGTDSNGDLYFILPKLSSVKNITSVRLKWDADYDTDDYEDDNAFKTFDATINLN
ncbi:hypothetical protein DY78_GL003065 [Lactiplantibacillus fabifermentans DSM 21115]|uniref:DUF4352 domain-containing protein n=1 Tax=Lactiplantibacillus fabifermentans DSM 21115 TaxID=1413187 RepID=A0A0R2NPL8_9LACO|nr:hypothetical protein DY78_GL003065 [Lactiplantibacillus fabifermentans DSM 21115]